MYFRFSFGVMVAVGTVAWFFLRKYALASDIPGAEENGILPEKNVFFFHTFRLCFPHLGKLFFLLCFLHITSHKIWVFPGNIFSIVLGIGAWFLLKTHLIFHGLVRSFVVSYFYFPLFKSRSEQEKAFLKIASHFLWLVFSSFFWVFSCLLESKENNSHHSLEYCSFVFAFLSFRNIGYYQDGVLLETSSRNIASFFFCVE